MFRIPAILTATYFTALVLGTHWPRADMSLGFEFTDKFLHLGAYAGLAALCRLTWLTWPSLAAKNRKMGFFFVLLLTIGMIDELTQLPIPGRQASLFDWIADGVGVACGLAVVACLWRNNMFSWLTKSLVESESKLTTDNATASG